MLESSQRPGSASGIGDAAPIALPLTTLIGREREVEQISTLLSSGEARLLTLTGPGGVGKTRLALQVAASLHERYAEGAYFVSLAPISDPELLLSTIAHTLGVTEAAGQPLLDGLCSALKGKRLLLILDNFEQVAAAAPGVADLLACAPLLHILVTSRIVLRIYGEREFPVPTLALPDALHDSSLEHLTQYEAVRLFIERARAAKPSFAINNSNAPAVAEICHRLDGLPLAIELAAARVKLLPPQALLSRLDRALPFLTHGPTTMPLRHQTLHNAIAWSYDLLTEDEKQLFKRLSLFVGGCTLEAAEAMCGDFASGEETDPTKIQSPKLDELAALVDQSLLRQEEQEDGEARFSMLETIREFAVEHLLKSEEWAEVNQRHTTLFVQLAEQAEPELVGAEQSAWLDRLALEHDNLRAVLHRAALAGDAVTGLRLGGALWRFWYMRGYLTEGRKWLSEALERGGEANAALRARALNGLGNIVDLQGDYDAARSSHEQALVLWEELGDKHGIARSLGNLGNVARLQGDYERSSKLHERTLLLYRELGQKWGVASSLHNLSTAVWRLGDYDHGRRLCEESLTLRRELRDKRGIASSLSTMGVYAVFAGNYEEARAFQEECLALWRELGDKAGIARSLYYLGEVVADQGDYQAAHFLHSDSLRLRSEMGNRRGVAECLQGLATAWRAQSDPGRLVRLLAAADELCAELGSPLTPQDRERYEKWLAFAREKLGPEASDKAWDEGKMLSIEEATALALTVQGSRFKAQSSGFKESEAPSRGITKSGLPYAPAFDLTAREVEVLRLVAVGLTNPAIALHLNVSINTVQSHLRSIFSKINVNTRGAAVRYAFEHNLS